MPESDGQLQYEEFSKKENRYFGKNSIREYQCRAAGYFLLGFASFAWGFVVTGIAMGFY